MSRILLSSLKYSYLKLNYASFTVQKYFFLKSTLPCINYSFLQHNYSSAAAAAVKVRENVDMKINQLDRTVKRLGRTTLKDVQNTLNEIQAAGSISVTQSLMIIRSCGSLLVEVKPEIRTKLVHRIWNILKDLDVKLDISHYNALLRVYLENDHTFVPSEILSDIEKKGLEPNRVTCQRLITRYCQMGDIAGATRVLQFMREKDMPINESVFNALISGHSQVNDMESAEGILKVMKEGGIEPSSETYTLLMCGYIKNGNLEKVEEIFKFCESMDIMFSDKDYFDIIYAYAMYGYEDGIDKVLSKIRKSASYNQDAMNFTFKLLTANKPEIAYKIMKSMLRASRPDGSILPLGNFFIAYLIRNDMPIDLVIKYCRDLMSDNLNPRALSIALENALRYDKKNSALELLRVVRDDKCIPMRPHYFWPLLVNQGKRNNITGLYEILSIMSNEFNLIPNSETIREYVTPFLLENKVELDMGKILLNMKSCGVPTSRTAGAILSRMLEDGKIREAAQIANEYIVAYIPNVIKTVLSNCFCKTHDVDSFVSLLQDISANMYWIVNNRETTENEIENLKDHREFIGEIIELVVDKLKIGHQDVVKQLLKKLIEAEIGISENKMKSIQNLVKDVTSSEMIDSLNKLASDEFTTPTVKSKPTKLSLNSMDDKSLERLYEMAKSKGEQPNLTLKRLLFMAYAKSGNCEKMQQIKKELEGENFIFNTGISVNELDAYVKNNKVEEALLIYNKLCETDGAFRLNPIKTLNLATMLVDNKLYDKAYDVLKRRVESDNVADILEENSSIRMGCAFKLLIRVAETGDDEKMKEFFDLLLVSKIIEANGFILGPLIRVHIKKGDYEAAMKEFEYCVQKYKATPLKNELTRYFIEKEDAVNLQKLTDLSTRVHGEINSLFDLMISFLECGRVKQAKKILETPGLRIKADRLQLICNNFVEKRSAENLKNLLKVTKDFLIIDRVSIYEKLLSIYNVENDPQSALALWLDIQEEDLQSSDTFLMELAELLRKNKMSVPFIVPERKTFASSKPRNDEAPQFRQSSKRSSNRMESDMKKEHSSQLVERLLQDNRYNEAVECFKKFKAETGNYIQSHTLKFLLMNASGNGDVDLILEMKRDMKNEYKKKMSIDNHTALAYLNADRVEEYISEWENGLNEIKNKEQLEKYLVSYPRSAIVKILLQRPEYVERVKAFTENCIKIDENNVMSDVFWSYYMCRKEYDEADKIWNKSLKNCNKIFYGAILENSRKNLDIDLGIKLLSYIKTKPDIPKEGFASIYSTLIDVCVQGNELEDAKKYLEQAISEMVPIEKIRYRILTSLKSACLDKNIDFPYTIPKRTNRKKVIENNDDSDSD